MRYLANGKEITVAVGTVIYTEGGEVGSDAVYYVKQGEVWVTRAMPDGYSFLYPVSQDRIFGAVPAIAGSKRTDTASAVSDCVLYVWNKEEFEKAVSLYIEFARLSIQELSQFMRAINQALA